MRNAHPPRPESPASPGERRAALLALLYSRILLFAVVFAVLSTIEPPPPPERQAPGWLDPSAAALAPAAPLDEPRLELPSPDRAEHWARRAAHLAERADERAEQARSVAKLAESHRTTVEIWSSRQADPALLEYVERIRQASREARRAAEEAVDASRRAFAAALIARSGLGTRQPDWARWAAREARRELAMTERSGLRADHAAERSAEMLWKAAHQVGAVAQAQAWLKRAVRVQSALSPPRSL